MITFKCTSCFYSYQVSEKELKNNPNYHRKCFLCGGNLEVDNLDEIVREDIEVKIKENVDYWFIKIGIEATMEMLEENKDLAVYRLYKIELKKRGLKLK